MVKVKEDLTGKQFGLLKVIRQVEDHVSPCGLHKAKWECECLCDQHTIIEVVGISLRNGHTKSCGCLQKEYFSHGGPGLGVGLGVGLGGCRKYNAYNLEDYEYGVGYTSNTNAEFYFDKEDYDLIKNYTWAEHIDKIGYHTLVAWDSDKKKNIRFHQVLGCKGYDHINRNTLDNRRNNLRPATTSENRLNRGISPRNKSGIIGVYYDKRCKKWRATIHVDGEQLYIKLSANKEDAIRARLEAEAKYYGEFAPQKHLFEQYGICNESVNNSENILTNSKI